MPPKSKTGKGGKGHKRAKNGTSAEAQVKELVLRQDGQAYGKVCKMLGNGRVSCKVFLETGEKTLMCIIPGKFRKRLWINMEDLVLVGIRGYQDDKLDILYKYSAVEAKRLVKLGEVPLTESDINDGENDQINDNIQWVTDQKEEKPETTQKKKSVTINGNASYISEDLLPPTDSDDEGRPKKSLINGHLNQKGKSLEGADSQQKGEETNPGKEETGSSGEGESESESGASDQEQEKEQEPEKKWKNNLKSDVKSKNVKGEEAKVEINLDDL